MKALKNESILYMNRITTAIADCYQGNTDPNNAELMGLYSFIGQCICEQGEKAFVVHLEETLTQQLPQIKGFSPRNLRRMRDFYRTYENSPLLKKQAQMLNWTQNAVILDCCETEQQRAFYICLAAQQNLSKLALIDAIENDAFSASATDTTTERVQTAVAPVCDCATAEAVDTTATDKPPCGAFVPEREPSCKGGDMPTGIYPVTPAQRKPINTKISASLYSERLTDRGKPPDKAPPYIPLGKNKNAPPNGRTIDYFKTRISRPTPIAA